MVQVILVQVVLPSHVPMQMSCAGSKSIRWGKWMTSHDKPASTGVIVLDHPWTADDPILNVRLKVAKSECSIGCQKHRCGFIRFGCVSGTTGATTTTNYNHCHRQQQQQPSDHRFSLVLPELSTGLPRGPVLDAMPSSPEPKSPEPGSSQCSWLR